MDRRRLLPILLIVFVNFFGATIVLPSIPLYAKREFGASPEVISLILAAFFIAQFLASPWIGRLSDRYGRVPVLVISQFGTFLSFVLMAAAGSVTLLFIARVLDGITGGNIIVAQAYVTDVTPREKRTQALGLVFAAFGLGFILGPALGGILAATFGDRAPFYVGAIVALITVFITYFTLDESLTAEERMARRERAASVHLGLRDIFAITPLVLILIIAFATQFSVALLQATIALFGEAVIFAGYDESTVSLGVGLLLTSIGVGQVITQTLLLRPAIARFGERRLVVMGAVLRAVALYSLLVITSPWLIGSFSLLALAIAGGVMLPSLQSTATTTVSEDVSGSVLGVFQSAASLGIIIGTSIGGQLFAIAPTLPYAVGGTAVALIIVPAVILLRMDRAQPVPA
ncbi:MAG: TCR/Tet family MFS transporter [Chloroflexi bacterium]|nr:TCR/Tet family MFS transporter [Chloroflexota bacterium]